MYIYDTNNNWHILLAYSLYFSCIIQMDDTDDRAESFCRHRRESNKLRMELKKNTSRSGIEKSMQEGNTTDIRQK